MFKSSTSVNSFKSNLKSNHPQKPPYHYIGKRLGQILHSRLCMHCSSLNQHLYSKNIVDSPLCQCGAIETTEHYFLYCPLYNVHRQLFYWAFFLTILWFHIIIIFLDRPSSVTNKTLKFSWQCNPLLSTRHDLTEIRVVNSNHDLSFDIWHKQCMCSLYFLFISYFFSLFNFTCITVYYYIKFNLS